MRSETPRSDAGTGGGEVTYLEAISRALRDEMRRDSTVFLLGQDIAAYGGAFKVTRGFLDEFGPERVVNTPVAESGMIGMAVGAALLGRRPVVEMQFADFASCGFNQLVNVAAKLYYRMKREVPLVIRLPFGGGVGAGPFHSQCVEGWFLHTPGLKVAAPAWPYDAHVLMKAAIRDPNPVLFFEHKYLYRRLSMPATSLPCGGRVVDGSEENDRLEGFARVVREGDDVTLVAYGWMVHRSLEAAEILAEEDISVEVVDLRVLAPLDEGAVLRSVRKTGKVVLVHEATTTGGFGAELAARIADRSFDYLDGPVRRVAFPDTPVPYHRALEAKSLPDPYRIAGVVRELKTW